MRGGTNRGDVWDSSVTPVSVEVCPVLFLVAGRTLIYVVGSCVS